MDHENDLYAMFKHFVRFVELSQKDPVILTLDGHYSHSRNIEVIDCSRENGMHIFAFPRVALTNSNLRTFPSCSL